jgi:hypothetical protein
MYIYTDTRLLALEKVSADEDKHEGEDNTRTIRPIRSPSSLGMTKPLAKSPPRAIPPIVEDYSDLGTEDDDERIEEKVEKFKVGTR